MSADPKTELSPLELMRIAPPEECERLSGNVSWETLKKEYADKVVRISQRRSGMRVGDALHIRHFKAQR